MTTKICISCNKEKELNKIYFYKRRSSSDGFYNTCKVCALKFTKDNRKNKIEYYTSKDKEYYLKNKKNINQKHIQHYFDNQQYYQQQFQEYYKNNKETIKSNGIKYRQDNKDIIAIRRKQYRKNNHSKIISRNVARRAKKLNATPSWSEKDKILILYQKAKWLESLTGLKYHVDHIIPLQGQSVSGLHVWANLQILEASENIKKSNTT